MEMNNKQQARLLACIVTALMKRSGTTYLDFDLSELENLPGFSIGQNTKTKAVRVEIVERGESQ